MDLGKSKGQFASAYKLSRSNIDKKAARRQRRSIEQKNFRHDEINKRRNLNDLSPLQEADGTITHNKSYKDKTPLKRKDDPAKKGFDRLEQLKKWKEERERKRKTDAEESRKRNPVFRVSKAVDHRDTALYSKGQVKRHPVKAQPVPVAKQPVQKPKPSVETSAKPLNKVRPETSVRPSQHKLTSVPSSRKVAKKEVPISKPIAPSTRTLRSSNKVSTVSEPNTHATRQASKNKAPSTESKFKAIDLPKPVFEPEPLTAQTPSPDFNHSRVTRRGETTISDSFAPSDFAFNVSSFVFRPLSPASAAGFLCPNQDTSCASFIGTDPKRSSTPKRNQRAKEKSVETNMNATQNETQLLGATVIEQNDETVVSSPENRNKSVRRSQRKSMSVDTNVKGDLNNTKQTDEANVSSPAKTGHSLVKRTPQRRNTRRSVTLESVPIEEMEMDKQEEEVKPTPRRSLRRSVLANSVVSEDVSSSENEDSKPRRSSRRRSAVALNQNSDSDNKESLDDETSSPAKKRRSLRHSITSSEVKVETPKDHRKSRRSVAKIEQAEIIPEEPEVQEASQDSDNVFEDENVDADMESDKENCGPCDDVQDGARLSSGLSDGFAALSFIPEKRSSRGSAKKTPRNKSFGGFRVPTTDSRILSASRKARRKTLMPKSPEEWVEVLSHSPMVEMSRRKPKLGNTSLPILNFDDCDLEEPNSTSAAGEMDSAETDSSNKDAAYCVTNEVPVAMDTDTLGGDVSSARMAESKKKGEEKVVQVGEISSTRDESLSEESTSDGEHDVPYFRNLLSTETSRLTELCDYWNSVNEDTQLPEDVHGQIRTTVGQANLLMNQRFNQFSGLVDNCEFKLGEKETTCTDLKGFWEMIYYQVEDVDKKFVDLTKLKENNWIDDKPKQVVKKTKKKVTKPPVTKPVVKSRFAAFRAQMKKQKGDSVGSPMGQTKEEEKVFEVPGFFTVASPVRTPKVHCEGGTPKKATPSSSSQSAEKPVLTELLHPPSSNEILTSRTPVRKSYVPAVPSPLLQDTTPIPRPARSCTQRTPIPKRIMDEVDNTEISGGSESNRAKKTPVRRSLRPRKSVNFAEEVVECPAQTTEGTDAEFARLLQPMQTETEGNEIVDAVNDSFSKYLQPSICLDTSVDKDDTPRQSRRRRSSLKVCRSTERRRSRQRSVHFSPSLDQDAVHHRLPHTPYNKDSLVKQRRTTRSLDAQKDIFDIENIDNDENVPPPSFRSPRPSLLGTPPDMKRSTVSIVNVPTDTLISFTP